MVKKVGMMQPYLFPYLGFFQLISAVDAFVLGDDLQYVKETWINRNRILVNGKEKTITFPLKKDSHLLKINERYFAPNFAQEMDKLLQIISHAYCKAPNFQQAFSLVQEIIRHPEDNLARYAINSIKTICDYLEIRTPIVIASDLAVKDVKHKQDRVIQTLNKLDGDMYINPIGGVDLYEIAYFREFGKTLKFHQMGDVRYRQFGQEFVSCLSIIDVLMFNKKEEVQEKLSCYSLVDNAGPQAGDISISA